MNDRGIERFLVAVEQRMREDIARTPATAPARALLDAGGKRLRVQLMWWSATATASSPIEPDHEALLCAATAVEFAHLGSLIHDDIADGSATRRGVPTIHRRHGIAAAVDTGAALVHLASATVARLGPLARGAARRAILATCRGQIRELVVPFVSISPRARLTIMQEKTGGFFELAVALGAIVTRAPRAHRAAVQRFARRFGVAFQIADDVLDLVGDPRELGRANGADLREGVTTLPLLLASDPGGALGAALERVRKDPTSDAIGACADLIERGGGVHAATQVARWWLDRATQELDALPRNDAIEQLRRLSHASVARGVRRGLPTFIGTPAASVAAFAARTSWIAALTDAPHRPGRIFDARIARMLDWFHPGVAGVISGIATAPAIAAAHASAYRTVPNRDAMSSESRVAAEALSLAHAITAHAMSSDPPWMLALVDALHCVSIAESCRAVDPDEHRQMAAHARDSIGARLPATTAPSSTVRRDPSLAVSLPA